MKDNGTLKIIFKKHGHPAQMSVGTLLRARTDEFTVLFHILKRYEHQQSVNARLTEIEAEQLRSRVAALGITDVMWEFV
ncbi:hypothetical protein [Pseudomonas sp. YL-218 TE3947]|uniref:hypothetical protein n=1 Tax=Pseudomonas TaxID=286 RepID=UPI003D21583B